MVIVGFQMLRHKSRGNSLLIVYAQKLIRLAQGGWKVNRGSGSQMKPAVYLSKRLMKKRHRRALGNGSAVPMRGKSLTCRNGSLLLRSKTAQQGKEKLDSPSASRRLAAHRHGGAID